MRSEDVFDECCNNFASRLKYLRCEKNISILQLSQEMNYKTELIEEWESGFKLIDLPDAVKLARYFDVTLGFLIGSEDRGYVRSKDYGTVILR